MDRSLLVADQDVTHPLLREDRVIDRQHRAAGIAEDVLHALIGERFDHHFGAGHFPAHLSRPSTRLAANKKGPLGAMSDASSGAAIGLRGHIRTSSTITI